MESYNKNPEPKGHTRMQWVVAITVNLSILTYGFQCGWVSPMTKILQSEESPVGRPLTDSEISLVAGIPSLAAIVGISFLLYVVETHGRRKALFAMAVLQLMCWIIKLCPSNPSSLIVARVFCGLGAGGGFHVLPMYVKEIAQDNIRGTLGSIVVLFQSFGILTMYIIGGYLSYYSVLYIVTPISVLNVMLLFKLPESPSFLVKQGKSKEATAAVAFLRGLHVSDKEVQDEIAQITKADDYFKSIPNISFFSIFKNKAWRRGFIILLMIIIMHGSNGTFSIINYASTILKNSEMRISPEVQSLAIPIFFTIGVVITMLTVDKLGRKMLLGIAFSLSALAFAILASNQLLRDHGWSTPNWLPIVLILITVCCYGAGISPLPFIIMTEMFNFQIRAKLIACLSGLAWLTTFFQLVSFTAVTNTLGIETSFFTFSAINLMGVIVVLFALPETAGKSVERIEAELRKEKNIEEHNAI